MEELLKYEIDKNIFYCPLTLNNNIVKEQPGRGGVGIQIEDKMVMSVFYSISEDRDNNYILDFYDIEKLSITNEDLHKLFRANNIALYFSKNFYEQKLKGNNVIETSFTEYRDEKGYFIYNNMSEALKSYLETSFKEEKDIIKKIHTYIYIRFFIEEIDKYNHIYDMSDLKYLESSNVYINYYINIKALFLHPNYMYFLINDLVKQIKASFDDLEKTCLLGVSNNGIILSRLLAYQLHLDAKGINHLGPRYCLDDDNEFIKELKNKKFILVSDVICLGGEYRLAKGILNVLNSKLLGAVCVVKIRDIYRNEERKRNDKIFALVDDINTYEIDGKKIDYKIYVDKEKSI